MRNLKSCPWQWRIPITATENSNQEAAPPKLEGDDIIPLPKPAPQAFRVSIRTLD
ncbi:hypothetical protein AA14337_3125 [Acetobacter malorum DSM 14337]|uniref:Uncharacterized protein n=1 Tax=Acetobacter malorum DSM 14337 TaxID=1307910 RepID=A0ABQ0PZR1_9PROT|nr:hypothetical protein AA14337_3125 [Acetobacter malorum DSM 14337]